MCSAPRIRRGERSGRGLPPGGDLEVRHGLQLIQRDRAAGMGMFQPESRMFERAGDVIE
jgi:hypothetical protein